MYFYIYTCIYVDSIGRMSSLVYTLITTFALSAVFLLTWVFASTPPPSILDLKSL